MAVVKVCIKRLYSRAGNDGADQTPLDYKYPATLYRSWDYGLTAISSEQNISVKLNSTDFNKYF